MSPGPRQLFPVANRPILFHSLEMLRAAGILETTILADAGSGTAIRTAVDRGHGWGMTIRHAEWRPSAGVAGALACARDFVADEPVLVQEAGAVLRERMHGHIAAFARERLDALALKLAGPTRAPAPGYLLSPAAVRVLLDGDVHHQPIAEVRAAGGRVRIQRVDGCLSCHGDVHTLLESNRRMLEGVAPTALPSLGDEAQIQGPVEIHPSATVERSLVRGPAIIGEGARITDAYIGPYTAIGAGAEVEGTEIEHSIVLPDATLRFIGARLESSVIGRGARVTRGFEVPSALRLSIGDEAEVVLR